MRENITLFAKGMVIGIANIIPGVSGGTMAVVLGVYERLIEAIGNFFISAEKRKEYFLFLLKLMAGAGIAILVFSWVMDYLLTHYGLYTYLFFIGLIAGSIPSIYKAHPHMKLTLPASLAFLLGMMLLLGMDLFFSDISHQAENTAPLNFTATKGFIMFISGILSGGSMIMPGISGSFILVLLGQYHTVIRAVKNFDVVPLIFLGAGIALGIWMFAKLIDFLLKRYPKETFYFILGLVVASLVPIFPGFPQTLAGSMVALLIVICAIWISYRLGERK